jgi:hypothetical protein
MEQATEAMLLDELAEEVELESKVNEWVIWLFGNSGSIIKSSITIFRSNQVLSSVRLEIKDIENSTLNPLAEEFIPSPAPGNRES